MLPNDQQIYDLHQRLAPSQAIAELVIQHCEIVADIALWCVDRNQLDVDRDLLRAGALLHDVGTYAFFAHHNLGTNPYYMQHAITGAKIIIDEGYAKAVAAIVETHILMGLSKQEISRMKIKLPLKDYSPQTLEAELICYADRFHSKDPTFNSYQVFYERLNNDMPIQAKKMKQAAEKFGIPDIATLAKKYNHPVR